MPLFACSKCETVDNTALGDFWHRQAQKLPPLCSACGRQGEWHGQFPQRKADAACLVNPSGHLMFAEENAEQFKHLGPWTPYQPKDNA
jgi:hypothetical protein